MVRLIEQLGGVYWHTGRCVTVHVALFIVLGLRVVSVSS